MPRVRKTASGAPAQPIGATPGQNYGMGVQEMALQRALPSPNNQAAAAPAPTPQAPPQPAQQPQQQTLGDVMAAAQGMSQQPGLLQQPTAYPQQPVTHGLPSGPGAGPEALGFPQASKTGQWMRLLSQRTGDPTFARLADQAGM